MQRRCRSSRRNGGLNCRAGQLGTDGAATDVGTTACGAASTCAAAAASRTSLLLWVLAARLCGLLLLCVVLQVLVLLQCHLLLLEGCMQQQLLVGAGTELATAFAGTSFGGSMPQTTAAAVAAAAAATRSPAAERLLRGIQRGLRSCSLRTESLEGRRVPVSVSCYCRRCCFCCPTICLTVCRCVRVPGPASTAAAKLADGAAVSLPATPHRSCVLLRGERSFPFLFFCVQLLGRPHTC